jgi:hypothetical protein
MPISTVTTLVTVDTARAVLGLDAESVVGLCEAGQLAAWNLGASGADRRELRIWADSLRAHIDGIRIEADVDDAIANIVGHPLSQWIPCTQVAQRFTVHRRSVYRWAEAGDLVTHQVDHQIRVLRASLFPFLRSRRVC